MSKPFFSVIVPEHNSEKFMRIGLDSIRSQEFTDYELLIICDACTDSTAEIAREYSDKVIEINEGRCARSRNKGLDMAQGKWLLFMDDDDAWDSQFAFGMIHEGIERYEKYGNPIDVLAFDFFWKDRGIRRNEPGQLYTAVWNKAFRRSFIESIGARFPDWAHSDDDGFSRIVHPEANIGYLHAVLYFYNFMRKGSLTWQIENGLIDGNFPGKKV